MLPQYNYITIASPVLHGCKIVMSPSHIIAIGSLIIIISYILNMFDWETTLITLGYRRGVGSEEILDSLSVTKSFVPQLTTPKVWMISCILIIRPLTTWEFNVNYYILASISGSFFFWEREGKDKKTPHTHCLCMRRNCQKCWELRFFHVAILSLLWTYIIRFITPRACTGWSNLFVCLSVVTTKITRSQHLGIWSIREYNESVEVGEILASVCLDFEWHGLRASQIVYFSRPS